MSHSIFKSVRFLFQSQKCRGRSRALSALNRLSRPLAVERLEDRTLLAVCAVTTPADVIVPGEIHGQKFEDTDGDGVRDAGEPGLDGWTIELLDQEGTVVATTLTMSMDLNTDAVIDPESEQGLYWFDSLPPGGYQVREVLQPNWEQTFPRDLSFAPATNFPTGHGGGGYNSLAVADFDGDGDADVATANNIAGNLSILLNNGDGTYGAPLDFAVGGGPWSLTTADLDGDGDSDLAVANMASLVVLLNDGNGNFTSATSFPAGGSPRGVTAGDLDGDGDVDLAVANAASDDISVLLNNGDGTFAAAVNYATGDAAFAVTTADLDGDGDVDLAVANVASDDVSVLLNNGDGTFAAAVNHAVGRTPVSLTAGDLDGDGDLDLAVANSASPFNVSVLLNNGDGSFATAANTPGGVVRQFTALAAGDLDRDGDLDLALASVNTSINPGATVLLNNGDGTFTPGVGFAAGDQSTGIGLGDLDGDGDLDLAVHNSASQDVSILLNTLGTYTVTLTSGEVVTGRDFGNFRVVLPVQIDIKPGSEPNSINLRSKGTVPVAIFSSADFDATTVDPTTVTLAGADVRLRGQGTPMASQEDVNGDALMDLVVHMETQALQLTGSDTEAVLEGKTFDGVAIRGTDSVRIVPESMIVAGRAAAHDTPSVLATPSAVALLTMETDSERVETGRGSAPVAPVWEANSSWLFADDEIMADSDLQPNDVDAFFDDFVNIDLTPRVTPFA